MAATTSKATGKASATGSLRLISKAEIKRAPRGRKAVWDDGLMDLLSQIPADGETVGVLDDFAGTPKAKRPSVGSVIRRHWERVHGNDAVKIEWDPETNAPQVSARV